MYDTGSTWGESTISVMDAEAQIPGQGHAPTSTLAERETGFLSGLVSLLPRLGYSAVLPSVFFERQERPLARVPSFSRSRASSVGSDDDSTGSAAFRQESSDLLLPADQPETSTSGRTAQNPAITEDNAAAAAERHRLGAGGSFDLQVLSKQVVAGRNLSPPLLFDNGVLLDAGNSALGGKDSSVPVTTVYRVCIHTH